MTEPERGLEPTDLPYTRRLLYPLSYSGIEASIAERGIGVNSILQDELASLTTKVEKPETKKGKQAVR